MSLLITVFFTEVVMFPYFNGTLPAALWIFYRIKDTKKRLTLMDNPHFYKSLHESLEEYGSRTEINPAKELLTADKF